MTKLNKTISILVLTLSLSAAVLIPVTAYAQDNSTNVFLQRICPQPNYQQNPDSNPNLATCVNNIYTFLLRLSGIIALIVLIFAGYIYMVAGGDGQKISKAKDLLWRVVQGVLILVIAYVLLKFLNPELVELKNPIEILNHGRD